MHEDAALAVLALLGGAEPDFEPAGLAPQLVDGIAGAGVGGGGRGASSSSSSLSEPNSAACILASAAAADVLCFFAGWHFDLDSGFMILTVPCGHACGLAYGAVPLREAACCSAGMIATSCAIYMR